MIKQAYFRTFYGFSESNESALWTLLVDAKTNEKSIRCGAGIEDLPTNWE